MARNERLESACAPLAHTRTGVTGGNVQTCPTNIQTLPGATYRDAGRAAARAGEGGALRPLLTLREAASLLRVCDKTIWNLTKRGKLAAVRIGVSVRYDADDVRDFIERQKGSRASASPDAPSRENRIKPDDAER